MRRTVAQKHDSNKTGTATSSVQPNRRRMLAGAAGLCLASMAGPIRASDNRTITLVVPYQAGGNSDALGRAIGAAAAEEMKTTVVVENKAGAEGQIGAQDVMRGPKDGTRVLLAGAGSLLLLPELRHNPPYDPVNDFTPIAGNIEFSFFLYVHPSVPANTLEEFVDYVKANPGKVNLGTGSNTSIMSTDFLFNAVGGKVERIAYKGETSSAQDLLAGRIQGAIATAALLTHVKSGGLKVLATTLTQRSPLVPDVPTVVESGFPELPFGGGWLGVFGPANMPDEAFERVNKGFTAALNRPDMAEMYRQLGLVYTPMSAEQYKQYIKDQTAMYKRMAVELNMPKQ